MADLVIVIFNSKFSLSENMLLHQPRMPTPGSKSLKRAIVLLPSSLVKRFALSFSKFFSTKCYGRLFFSSTTLLTKLCSGWTMNSCKPLHSWIYRVLRISKCFDCSLRLNDCSALSWMKQIRSQNFSWGPLLYTWLNSCTSGLGTKLRKSLCQLILSP